MATASTMTTPREIMFVGALVDDVIHGDFSFSKSSEAFFGLSPRSQPPPEHEEEEEEDDDDNDEEEEEEDEDDEDEVFDEEEDDDDEDEETEYLQPNGDGLVVEFCTTFATEASEGYPQLPAKNSIAITSATETTTEKSMTTSTAEQSKTTGTKQSHTTTSDPEPTGFLGRFFQSRKARAGTETSNEFDIEEIAIAEDSKDDYDEEFENSTMDDSDSEDGSASSDVSSKQSFLYEASTVGESQAPFLGSMSSVSMAEQSTVTSQASSVSETDSRDDYAAASRASSLSYTETRDDCETALRSMSSHTIDEQEEEEEDYDTVADEEVEMLAEEPQTVTLTVSELMNKAVHKEIKKPKPIQVPPMPKKLKQMKQLKMWLPWQKLSRREKRSSFGSEKLEAIQESEEELFTMMEDMKIHGSDDPSAKRKTQTDEEDSNNKKHKTSNDALFKLGPEWEITSFKPKNQKRFMPWSRRSPAKENTYVITVRAEPSKEMTV
jgi:hypothetical protein